MQQCGLFAERHGVCVGEHADRRADADTAGAAEQQRGERDGRRARPVRHEVVLGQPDRVEPRLLGDLRRSHRAMQCLSVALSRELGRQYKTSYTHRTPVLLGAEAAPCPA